MKPKREFAEFRTYFVKRAKLNQKGHGFPVFREYNSQVGGIAPILPAMYLYYMLNKRNQKGGGFGSFFKGLMRALIPVAKGVGKAVGKQALNTGIDIVRDVSQGHTFKEASQKRLNEAGDALIDKTKQKVDKIMSGGGKRNVNKRDAFRKKLFSLIGPPSGKHQFKKGKVIKKK